MPSERSNPEEAFHVPPSVRALSAAVAGMPRLWRWLGNLESHAEGEALRRRAVDRPIYVAGLPRSGSTVLLEALAAHREVATHRYRDFPLLFTPIWWNRFLNRAPRDEGPPRERAHADRITVTAESPEALEEMLWMSFFPETHDPQQPSVLGPSTAAPAFERFYRDHLRKILLIRGGRRYAAKANYNIARLEYLLKLFPGARFIVPVRRPRAQIASLRKQHALLLEAARRHPQSVAYLDRIGHFEFGAHRRPIHFGDGPAVERVQHLWSAGEEVHGWARYWAMAYGHIAGRLRANTALRSATLIVRYEDLCHDSAPQLRRVLEHCGLDGDEPSLVERFANRLTPPTYYDPTFTEEEERVIAEETAEIAGFFGYAAEAAA